MKWCILFLCLFMLSRCSLSSKKKPNIIVIVADDMGFNDVGFHGSNEIPTPNIDALAYNGVILNSHYTQALCTPSRSSFLTGKYPFRLGMQHLVILEPEPWGLSLNETLLPQRLKRHGYKTHAVGKWHLGFFRKEYTPTYRGFDTHYGYWQGLQDYYDHTVQATFSNEHGYDMRRNMEVDWDAQGKYSTTLFTQEAIRLIKEHDTKDPMFMYLAHLAPHTGNDHDPLQAPDEEIAKFAHIDDPERRIYAAMVSMLDKSVGQVISALREKHMLENSIILFMSDNGAQTIGTHANHGSNFPLRGLKNSAWEGAHRGVAAIWSPLIKKPQRVSNHLMHISDWLPTFYTAIGLNHKELHEIDGKDMWKAISEGIKSPRTELVYNIDDVVKYGGLRQGEWKYLYGTTSQGKKDFWYGSSGKDTKYSYNEVQVLKSQVASALAGVITYQQIEEKHEHLKQTKENTTQFSINILSNEKIKALRESATVTCPKVEEEALFGRECDLTQSPCLFNLREDPCERINLAAERPIIVFNMENTLMKLRKQAAPPRNVPRDPNANPAKWNNTWVNWQDCEDVLKEKISFRGMSYFTIGLISSAAIGVILVVAGILMLCVFRSEKSEKIGSIFRSIEDPDDVTCNMSPKEREMLPPHAFREVLRSVD